MDNREMMSLSDEMKEQFEKLVVYCMDSGAIDASLYEEYEVKRGLRDSNGRGVLTGLTEISDVVGHQISDGKKVPAKGQLFYQGYNVRDLISASADGRYAFEEATYLLLFGALPTKDELQAFINILADLRELSGHYVRDVIMKAPNGNIMNALQKGILTLYSYDEDPEDISVPNVLRQSLQMIAKIPLMSVYAYYAYRHFRLDESLMIRNPKKEYSTAENILNILRPDGKFTPLEARVLDVALVLHAEHGGGNNSTFTNHVVTSSGTDSYSAIAASIASLKGPRHGGANLKAVQMFEDMKGHLSDWEDEGQIRKYLDKILNKEIFDRSGLIYGMGHAVYTISDPREELLKEYARKLAEEKGRTDEFQLYDRVERISKEAIAEHRRLFKPVCANVDMYSGLVYSMLDIPKELFTPVFAISRISGWCAHRLEELVNKGKIIRPAYKYVGTHRTYESLKERQSK